LLVVGAVVAALSLLAGLGVALGRSTHRVGPYVHRHHAGLSAKRVEALSRNVSSRVIVVLRNQFRELPATRSRIRARINAETTADATILRNVRRSGGRVYRQYHALNGFAARVSSTERAALKASPQVAAIIPDVVVHLPNPADSSPASTTRHGSVDSNAAAQQICPSDPTKPLLEPEALQTTHTAFQDPSTPQAQNLVTGTGVKVAFFADGLDINNPDFIRADGSHVFIDYQDFSGDGPNAPSNSLEAFGDASSIAAQGRQVYDISQFVNPAHPLPAGCNITVRGIAPGASLIGIKVFGNADSAFNSVILQGLDYALSVDHPNVISESFGGYPIPDSTQDLTRQFNEQAVAAGTTVVESTGDSGVTASPSSASSDPDVIAAGASTTFRHYVQTTAYGAQFSNGTWLSDNISSIESGGFTMGGRVLDLVAPGEGNWALCTPDTAIYQGCVNYAGQPTNLESFGGTSESAPFIAGGAALVIQAYENTHGGTAPSPALVRRLLTSTATDLGAPGSEQGAGELNTLAAVQAAESVGQPSTSISTGLLTDPTQLDISGTAGSTQSAPVTVTNLASSPETVSAGVRALSMQLSSQTGSVTLDSSSPTFVDWFGTSRPYATIHFQVPSGADRLAGYLAWTGGAARVDMALIAPDGTYATDYRAQGDGNHGQVDVLHPAAGQWTGIIWRRDGSFTGTVQWQATTQAFHGADSVTPSSLTLAPGASGTFHVNLRLPSAAGDASQDLVLTSGSGATSVVPLALRSLVAIRDGAGSFSGNLVGGNGRNGFFQPGQIDTYDFRVPSGAPEVRVTLGFPNDPGTIVWGTLIAPDGQAVAGASNAYVDLATGNTAVGSGLETDMPSPQAGTWRFVVDVVNPVGGTVLSAPYSGHISLSPPPFRVNGLPNNARTVVRAGHASNATVTFTNNGPGIEQVFLDARTPQRQAMSLVSLTPDHNIALPLPAGTIPPLYLVPPETTGIDAAAQASEPVTFDYGFGDPDLSPISTGDTAAGSFSTPFATPGLWDIAPNPIGPFGAAGAPAGTVTTGMVAHTLGFDAAASASTGDVWQQAVDPSAFYDPIQLAPGQTAHMTLTTTPSGSRGQVVSGTLFVDVFNLFLDEGGEVVAIPYQYRVG
jgi:hypothetical protein